jgi:hypothetical protein
MKQHVLKTWPEPFSALVAGDKTFEFRKNDRDFKDGDVLVLAEFDPEKKEHSGRRIFSEVTYIVHGPKFRIPKGFCIMSLKKRGLFV